MNSAGVRTTGTVPVDTDQELRSAIEDLEGLLEEAGRTRNDVTVQLQSAKISDIAVPGRDRLRQRIGELANIGIDQLVMTAPDDDVERCIDAIDAFGKEVMREQIGSSELHQHSPHTTASL